MRWFNGSLLALALASFSVAADAPIRLPAGPVLPQPMPNPGEPVRLIGDAMFVVDSDVPCIVLASPAGLVSITEEVGPIRLRGRFVDGTGTESRTYKGKAVFVVEGVASGRVELLVIPVGAAKVGDVIRRTVIVEAGHGPQPPPKPDDPPVPVTSFRVFLVFESGATYTAAQTGVLYSKAVADWLNANCTKDSTQPGWRRRDKDADAVNETAPMRTLWDAVKPKLTAIPCLVVERNGTADIIPLPVSEAEALATLKRYAEGK